LGSLATHHQSHSRLAFSFLDVEQFDDVRMIQSSQQPDLALQTGFGDSDRSDLTGDRGVSLEDG
jgi:hypothetical protein